MNITGLMIDDWVAFPHGRDRVRELSYIPGHGHCASFAASAQLFSVEVEKLKPIPLTPEILEKNGFEKTFAGMSFIFTFSDNPDYYALSIDEYTDSIWRLEYTNCEMRFPLVRMMLCFVHELQHALRLCGIDKEIIL